MPCRQVLLDPGLSLAQPIHRGVQVVLRDIGHPQFLGQRAGTEQFGRGQLGSRFQHSLHDQSQHPVARGRPATAEDLRQADAVRHGQRRFHMPVRQGREHAPGLLGRHQRLVAQHAAQAVDLVCGPVGEIGEGAFDDPASLAVSFAEQDGGACAATGDAFDVHGRWVSLDHGNTILHIGK